MSQHPTNCADHAKLVLDTAKVESFRINSTSITNTAMDSYEDFVCKTSTAYSAACSKNSISSSQQSVRDAHDDVNADVEQITYWDETPQEEEEEASVFLASMGAK